MIALTGAKVYTMCGEVLEAGTVLVEKGKIKAVGTHFEIPSDAQRIDVHGKVITPGLIDAHSHLGLYGESMAWAGMDVNEYSEPITPGLRAIDAINPADIGLKEAYRGGVTTVMIAPGSTNPIGGQCAYLKTLPKATVDEMVLRPLAGLKIAFGENPKNYHGQQQKKKPITRMAVASLIREAFYKARHYMEKGSDKEFDLGMEALVRVLKREMPLRAHAHRADDIVTAVRIAREFDVDIIIEHATEAHLIADFIAKENVPVIVGPTLTTRVKMELKDKSLEAPAILYKHGAHFAMMSDHPVIPSGLLPVYAGLATRFGLPEERALAMITSEAAKILKIDDQVGSLKQGLDADLVIWSGHPFTLSSRPEKVMINGILS